MRIMYKIVIIICTVMNVTRFIKSREIGNLMIYDTPITYSKK